MHIHILGICGTFMGSLAVLAKNLGHTVTGSDANVYPPMSTQLEAQGISLMQGYEPEHLQPRPDLVIVGNAMKRGIAAVEYVLNEGIPYTSGPQWLAQYVLQGKHVLGSSGHTRQNHNLYHVGMDFRTSRFRTRLFDWWCA
jgi:UDP-N-acetylmuramate: L-alanyl-gamma-D-glutamyl-meso-diaminopimelate ligase